MTHRYIDVHYSNIPAKSVIINVGNSNPPRDEDDYYSSHNSLNKRLRGMHFGNASAGMAAAPDLTSARVKRE